MAFRNQLRVYELHILTLEIRNFSFRKFEAGKLITIVVFVTDYRKILFHPRHTELSLTKTEAFLTKLEFHSNGVTLSYYSRTSIIQTSIIWISRLSGLFLWSLVGYDYLLVTIKIRSHILFKTTALKGAVKCKGILLSKSRGSARACRKVGLN